MHCLDCGAGFLGEGQDHLLCSHCARDRDAEEALPAEKADADYAQGEVSGAAEGGAQDVAEEAEQTHAQKTYTPEDVIRNPTEYDMDLPIALVLAFKKSYLRVPTAWVKGGIPALMDQASSGLWRLFTHLWRYGNLKEGHIFPSKRTLARETGFKDGRTLNHKLAI